jgi:hypothetical protein
METDNESSYSIAAVTHRTDDATSFSDESKTRRNSRAVGAANSNLHGDAADLQILLESGTVASKL